MTTQEVLNLINTASDNFAKLIAGIFAQSGLSEAEIRAARDKMSLDTHSLIDAELAKLDNKVPAVAKIKSK